MVMVHAIILLVSIDCHMEARRGDSTDTDSCISGHGDRFRYGSDLFTSFSDEEGTDSRC